MREVLGRLLRVRRVAMGLTLAEVADRAGISVQYLSEVERGLKDASSEMIAAVAGALGMQLHDVLVLSSQLVAPAAPVPVSSLGAVSTGSASFMRGDVMLAA